MPTKQFSDIKNDCEDSDIKLLNSIKSISRSKGFITHKFKITKIPSSGDNYMGELAEVNLKGTTSDGSEKNIYMFVKTRLPGGDNIKVLSMSDVYYKELYVYKDLSKIYNELQEDANIPMQERYKFVKCFEESDPNTIIMENIAKKGYISCDRFKIITIDYAENCIKQLAKFHALSFVLEKKENDYYNKTIRPMKYPFLDNEEFAGFINNMTEVCLKHLDGEYKNKLKKFTFNVANKLQRRMQDTEKVRCLCHGDFRAMNIMVNETNVVATAIPIDYQFIFYGSPVTDIIYFIFGSTDREFRKKHLENLKNLYFNTLTAFLRYFDLDINDCYPREKFDKDFFESLDIGLMISIWFFPVTLAGADEVLDLNKTDLADVSFSINQKVKSRLQDAIDDLTEWGLM